MWSETRVLSNVWWPIRVRDVRAEKTLAVWLNSSLGLLTIFARRTSTRGGWIAMKKADLEDLPVLDFRHLSPTQLQGFSDLFDKMAEAEFERLPSMAHCPARQSPGRRRFRNPRPAQPRQASRAIGVRAGCF